MSYILDALKKADSERQHGKTPDIYTQQMHHHELERDSAMAKNPMLWFFLAVLAILVGGFLYLNNLQRPAAVAPSAPTPITPAPAAVPSAQAAQAPATPPTTPAIASATAPDAPPTVAPPSSAPAAPTSEAAASTPEPIKLQPSTKLSTHLKNHKKPKAVKESPKHDASPEKRSEPKQSAEAVTETVTKRLRDLPTNIQNEIPPISVGGYIYSDNKADCQLLINKLLLHEGEQVSPGLILEKMMPHSAILNYKGNRFRISY
jgi:general secretion pathway protein B